MAEKDDEEDEEVVLQKRLDEMRKKKSTANPSMNAAGALVSPNGITTNP